eukprot:465349-Lingulodinium_polyedra.AAC.1
MLGPHDGGCLVVANPAPLCPPGTITHSAPTAAETTPAGINQLTRPNNRSRDPALGTGTNTRFGGET